MHTLKHRTLALIMSLIMILSCFAEMTFSVGAATSRDYEYKVLNDGTVSITKYNGSGTDIIIPSEIYGCKVTKIGYKAFSRCVKASSVTIPDGVVEIGSNAFYECTGLKNIVIPDSVKTIGELAFYKCTGLANISLPDSVTKIGSSAFGHAGLTSISIPNSVTCIDHLVFFACAELTRATIPDSVREIKGSAFYGCKSLVSITIPDSVLSIGERAIGYYYDENKGQDVKINNFTLCGFPGSAAEFYANENGFKFKGKTGVSGGSAVLNSKNEIIKVDNESKKVVFAPETCSGMKVWEFKSQFDEEISIDGDNDALIVNGIKFRFGDNEFIVIVKGDVQTDGKISAADARTILRIAAKLENPDEVTKESADINSDGKVTSSEARSVLRFAAKLDSKMI